MSDENLGDRDVEALTADELLASVVYANRVRSLLVL